MPQICRQPDDALQRAAVHASASRRAAKAGFEAVEYLFPYAFDKKELAAALRANGLEQVLHNLPAGNWDGGERGIACHPGPRGRVPRRRRPRHRLRHRARLPAGQLPGRQAAGGRRRERRCARRWSTTCASRRANCERAGIRLLIEPINSFDIPGFFLTRTDQALALIDEVGSPNLFAAVRHLPRAAHGRRARQHAARSTWRASATSSWPTTRAAASRARARSTTPGCSSTSMRIGYAGWIGCEYKPRGDHRGRPGLAHSPRRTERTKERKRHVDTPQKIGFIGLGIMGAPDGGPPARRGPPAVRQHARQGARALRVARRDGLRLRAAKWREQADIVFIMVPDTPDVEKVLFGEGGVAAGLVEGQDRGRLQLDRPDRHQGLRQEDRRRSAAATSMRRSRAAKSAPRRPASPSCAAATKPPSSA